MANMSSLPGSGQNYSSAQVLGAFLRLAMVGLVAVKKEVQPPGCPVQVGNEAAAGDGAMIDASTTALVEEPAADWAVLLHSLTWLLVGWLHGGCLALLRVNADHGMALLAVMKVLSLFPLLPKSLLIDA